MDIWQSLKSASERNPNIPLNVNFFPAQASLLHRGAVIITTAEFFQQRLTSGSGLFESIPKT